MKFDADSTNETHEKTDKSVYSGFRRAEVMSLQVFWLSAEMTFPGSDDLLPVVYCSADYSNGLAQDFHLTSMTKTFCTMQIIVPYIVFVKYLRISL